VTQLRLFAAGKGSFVFLGYTLPKNHPARISFAHNAPSSPNDADLPTNSGPGGERARIRIPWVWYRHLGLRSQDVFLASYPRSVCTWLGFILFEISTGKDAGFQGLEQRLPAVNAHRGVPPVLPGGGRFIKTYEKYRKDYRRAIFLVRAGSVEMGVTSIVSECDFDSFFATRVQWSAGPIPLGTWP
jgi:hypothetical protein